MSTDHYGIRVLERRGATLTVSVSNVYRDMRGWFPDPYDPEPFFTMLAEGATPGSLLNARFPDWADRPVCTANAPDYIRRVEVLDARNLFAPMEGDFYYEQDGHWPHEAELPQVTYRVTVSEPAVIAHLEAGVGFGSVCGLGYAERTAAPDDPEALEAWLLGLQLARLDGRPLPADAATLDRLRAALRVGTNRPCGYAWNAAEVLGALGEAARPAISDLARLIRDPDLDVSAYAAEALG